MNPFSKLVEKMSPESRARSLEKYKKLRHEMALAEVRKAMSFTQNDLAKSLNIKQAALARLENRTDMYISSLRKYITALGGKLDIVAHFPEGDVHIQNLHDIR